MSSLEETVAAAITEAQKSPDIDLADLDSLLDPIHVLNLGYPPEACSLADQALSKIAIYHGDDIEAGEVDTEIDAALQKHDPEMYGPVRAALARTPDRNLVIQTLTLTVSKHNEAIKFSHKQFLREPGSKIAILPLASCMHNIEVARAVVRFCSFKTLERIRDDPNLNMSNQQLLTTWSSIMPDLHSAVIAISKTEHPNNPEDVARADVAQEPQAGVTEDVEDTELEVYPSIERDETDVDENYEDNDVTDGGESDGDMNEGYFEYEEDNDVEGEVHDLEGDGESSDIEDVYMAMTEAETASSAGSV